jgi:hypothetical protein
LEHPKQPSLYDQAWDDGRYHFFAKLADPNTGLSGDYLLGVLFADLDLLVRQGLLDDSFIGGLSGPGLRALLWFLENAVLVDKKKEIALRVAKRPPATTVHRLHSMSRATRKMISQLKGFAAEIKNMDLLDSPVLREFSASQLLENSVGALRKFDERARQQRTPTQNIKYYQEEVFWVYRLFKPPALAYAAYRLYTSYSEPRILAKEAYARIGRFENEYLGCHLLDPYEAVRVQVRTFKRSPERKDMDSILSRLLTEKWFEGSGPDSHTQRVPHHIQAAKDAHRSQRR